MPSKSKGELSIEIVVLVILALFGIVVAIMLILFFRDKIWDALQKIFDILGG